MLIRKYGKFTCPSDRFNQNFEKLNKIVWHVSNNPWHYVVELFEKTLFFPNPGIIE